MVNNHKTKAVEQRKARLEQKLHEAQQLKAELAQRAQKGGEQPKHKGKMLAILIFTLIAIGLLVALLFLGPKIFAGKAIQQAHYNYAALDAGQAGIPPFSLDAGSLAPGDSVMVPIGVNIRNPSDGTLYDGNVFSFQLTYDPNVFTPSTVVSTSRITYVESRTGSSTTHPGFTEMYVAGTINPPYGFSDNLIGSAFALLANIEFTALDVPATTSSEIAFDSFSALTSSGMEIVDDTRSETITVEVPPAATEVCDGVDNNLDGTVDEGTLCPTGARCQVGRCIEFMCADTVDNDADSKADCQDTDCGGSAGPAGVTCCNVDFDCTGDLVCGASKVCEAAQPPLCGDGTVDAGEACDGSDLAGHTCITQSFSGGTLACAPDCTFDTNSCTLAGGGGALTCDGVSKDANEQCDGTDLGGATCESQGFKMGNLLCAASCTFDTSACLTERAWFVEEMGNIYDAAKIAGGWSATLVTDLARLLRSIFP